MGVHDFSIVTDRIHWGINHCFGNKSKSIPHTENALNIYTVPFGSLLTIPYRCATVGLCYASFRKTSNDFMYLNGTELLSVT